MGGLKVKITYSRKNDLLFISLDPRAKQVVCHDLAPGIVLEIDQDGRIAAMEILDASRRVNLATLPNVTFAEVA